MFGWFKKVAPKKALTEGDVITALLKAEGYYAPEKLREDDRETSYLVEVPSLFCAGSDWNEDFSSALYSVEGLSWDEKRALVERMKDMRDGTYLVTINNYTSKMESVWCQNADAVQFNLYATPALF